MIKQNFSSFQEYFVNFAGASVVSFKNLDGDATIISPVPRRNWKSNYPDYKSLSRFVDNADHVTQTAFWEQFAERLNEDLQDGKPRWDVDQWDGTSLLAHKNRYFS